MSDVLSSSNRDKTGYQSEMPLEKRRFDENLSVAQLSPQRESTEQLMQANMAGKKLQSLSSQEYPEIFTAARQATKADAQSMLSSDTAHFKK